MFKYKLIPLIVFSFLLLSCSTTFANYQGEGKDMGYWCTDCNRQHGPGETCPNQGSGSGNSDDNDDGVVRVDPEAERQNTAVVLNNDGNIYFNNGNYEMARERYKQALDKWPDNPTIKANYKRTLEKIEAKKLSDEQWEKEQAELREIYKRKTEEERQKTLDKSLFEKHKMPNFPIFGTTVVDLRNNFVNGVDVSTVTVAVSIEDPAKFRKEVLTDYSNSFKERLQKPNETAQGIVKSLKIKEPPSPVKNISALEPGDVILISPNGLMSTMINKIDRWASDNSNSPASHTATYLGEKYGKRFYLNNTPEEGPVVMEEKDFLAKYYGRDMNVATLVGEPLSKHEGDELWKGAKELAKAGGYGIKALPATNVNDNMVCSEASRWLLLRAGRRVPETKDEIKKPFVKFSPSDFYEEQQYFIVHTLGMNK